MFTIRYSSKSLGQKIREVHVTRCFRVEHRHWVSDGNNDYELRYFIQLITDAQTSLVLTGEAGWPAGLGGSRRGDWSPGHSQMCLKSSCRSLEQMVRTCASCRSSEFRYEEEWWGEGNMCNPVADYGALCTCAHLNVFALLFSWYFTDLLHIWPAQHHLHVEHKQKQAREWLHAFLQAEPEVYNLSLKFLLNGIILHKSVNQWTLSWAVLS